MKAKVKTPEKIYINPMPNPSDGYVGVAWSEPHIDMKEYTRTDAFIEESCEFWKDHLAGYDICEDDIERSIESFKLAMKL